MLGFLFIGLMIFIAIALIDFGGDDDGTPA